MTTMPVPAPVARGPYQGMLQIFQYNWPFYVASVIVSGGIVATLVLVELPPMLEWLGIVGTVLALFWSLGSLLVSHYIYDRSALYRWEWMRRHFPEPPTRWVNIHAGLDETSADLAAIFPGRPTVLDIYDPRVMSEPAIVRARRTAESVLPAIPADFAALPLDDGSCDAIFLIFAAHEIRDPGSRRRFFRELHRALDRGGRVMLVEHVRDLANFIAFGPGFLHFLPYHEWLRCAGDGGFAVEDAFRFTPFVRVLILRKP